MAYIIKAAELAERALAIYNNRDKWTYCQGGLGQLAESKEIKGLYNYYRKKGNGSTCDYPEWLKDYAAGRQCTDCSNFVNVLLGYNINFYSTWSLGNLPRCEFPIENAPVGSVLCMSGHVGVVCGVGECIDFYAYNHTCRKSQIAKGLWKYAVYLPEVEYEKPVDISVKVTDKERKVGDRVSYDDFVVTAKYADGHTAELKNYNYTPGMLTYPLSQVAIVYGDIIKYVSIKAELTGEGYAVMVPVADANIALSLQKDLINRGYTAAAVVRI